MAGIFPLTPFGQPKVVDDYFGPSQTFAPAPTPAKNNKEIWHPPAAKGVPSVQDGRSWGLRSVDNPKAAAAVFEAAPTPAATTLAPASSGFDLSKLLSGLFGSPSTSNFGSTTYNTTAPASGVSPMVIAAGAAAAWFLFFRKR